MTEREKLEQNLRACCYRMNDHKHVSLDIDAVKDFIISDRKAVLERVRKPLDKAIPVAKQFGRYDDLWTAINDCISEIDRAVKTMER